MLKLKIELKKLPDGGKIEFFINREQFDNINTLLSKKAYHFESQKHQTNLYHVSILKYDQ
jgi:hypothetical protein